MYHSRECPNCKNQAERDPEDERLGAVSGGAWSFNTETGELEGGGGASYKYICGHCHTRFTVHQSSETRNGISRDWEDVYISTKKDW